MESEEIYNKVVCPQDMNSVNEKKKELDKRIATLRFCSSSLNELD